MPRFARGKQRDWVSTFPVKILDAIDSLNLPAVQFRGYQLVAPLTVKVFGKADEAAQSQRISLVTDVEHLATVLDESLACFRSEKSKIPQGPYLTEKEVGRLYEEQEILATGRWPLSSLAAFFFVVTIPFTLIGLAAAWEETDGRFPGSLKLGVTIGVILVAAYFIWRSGGFRNIELPEQDLGFSHIAFVLCYFAFIALYVMWMLLGPPNPL